MFPLVVVVHADEETRVEAADQARDGRGRRPRADRGAGARGTAPRDCRCAAGQFGLAGRAGRAGPRPLVPAGAAARAQHPQPASPRASAAELVPYDPAWPDDARRIIDRLEMACGAKALRVDHIGSTAVPGMDAKDVIDIQVTVDSLDVADELADALCRRIRARLITADVRKPDRPQHVAAFDHTSDPALWRKRFHGAPIPGGRPMSTSGSTAGPVSSSRCCSWTG